MVLIVLNHNFSYEVEKMLGQTYFDRHFIPDGYNINYVILKKL